MLITSGIDSCCVESSPIAIVHAFMNILIINLFFLILNSCIHLLVYVYGYVYAEPCV